MVIRSEMTETGCMPALKQKKKKNKYGGKKRRGKKIDVLVIET